MKMKWIAVTMLSGVLLSGTYIVLADDFGDIISEGLSERVRGHDENSVENIEVSELMHVYKECVKAEYDYIENHVNMEELEPQQAYYVEGVKHQLEAFSDDIMVVESWNQGQLERYRALYYMNLEGSITNLDPDILLECKKVLGTEDDNKEELVIEFQTALDVDADGDFGAGGRTALKEFLSEKDIELPYIIDLENVSNDYITRDLLNTIQNLGER